MHGWMTKSELRPDLTTSEETENNRDPYLPGSGIAENVRPDAHADEHGETNCDVRCCCHVRYLFVSW